MGSSAAVQEDPFNRGQRTNWQKSTTIQLTLKAGNSTEMSSERTSQCSFPLLSPPCFSSLAHQLSSCYLFTFLSSPPSHPLFTPFLALLFFSLSLVALQCSMTTFFIISAPLCLTLSNSVSSFLNILSLSCRYLMMEASVTHSPINPSSQRIWTPCQSVGPLTLMVPWW